MRELKQISEYRVQNIEKEIANIYETLKMFAEQLENLYLEIEGEIRIER